PLVITTGHVRCLCWGVAAGAGTATWPPTAVVWARSRCARARPPGVRWPPTSVRSTRCGAWRPTGPATSSAPLPGAPSHGRRYRCGGRCVPGSRHRYAHPRRCPGSSYRTPESCSSGVLQVAVQCHGQRGQITGRVHHVGTHPCRPAGTAPPQRFSSHVLHGHQGRGVQVSRRHRAHTSTSECRLERATRTSTRPILNPRNLGFKCYSIELKSWIAKCPFSRFRSYHQHHKTSAHTQQEGHGVSKSHDSKEAALRDPAPHAKGSGPQSR